MRAISVGETSKREQQNTECYVGADSS